MFHFRSNPLDARSEFGGSYCMSNQVVGVALDQQSIDLLARLDGLAVQRAHNELAPILKVFVTSTRALPVSLGNF